MPHKRWPALLAGTVLAFGVVAVNAAPALATDRPPTPPTNGPCGTNQVPRDMQVSEIKGLIASHESAHGLAGDPTKYVDTRGHPTVGIGFNLDRSGAQQALADVGAHYAAVRAGLASLTQTQITQLFEKDIAASTTQIRTLVPGFDHLTMSRQAALLDMIFNLGATKFAGFPKLIAAVNRGDFDAAAAEMTASTWATQVGTRATKDTRLMKTGVVCDPKPVAVPPPPPSSGIPSNPTTNSGGTTYPAGVNTYQPEWSGGGNGPQQCRIEKIEVFYEGEWIGTVDIYC